MDTKTTSFIAFTAILAVAAYAGGNASRQGESSDTAPSRASSAQADQANTVLGATTGVAQGINEQLANCTNPVAHGRSLIGIMVSCAPTN